MGAVSSINYFSIVWSAFVASFPAQEPLLVLGNCSLGVGTKDVIGDCIFEAFILVGVETLSASSFSDICIRFDFLYFKYLPKNGFRAKILSFLENSAQVW